MKPANCGDRMIYSTRECDYFNALRRHHTRQKEGKEHPFFADAVAVILGLDEEWAQETLEAWVERGWWECGVSERSGWFTSDAPEKLP